MKCKLCNTSLGYTHINIDDNKVCLPCFFNDSIPDPVPMGHPERLKLEQYRKEAIEKRIKELEMFLSK